MLFSFEHFVSGHHWSSASLDSSPDVFVALEEVADPSMALDPDCALMFDDMHIKAIYNKSQDAYEG